MEVDLREQFKHLLNDDARSQQTTPMEKTEDGKRPESSLDISTLTFSVVGVIVVCVCYVFRGEIMKCFALNDKTDTASAMDTEKDGEAELSDPMFEEL